VKIRKHIPNALTCANLACGFYACILALSGSYGEALIAILAASIFDFADGMAARLLHSCSPTGKDLDSLADMVSFGVAPGMMLFDFIDRTQKTVAWSHPTCGKLFLLAAFAIPVFSALRLAKFNNDARQHTHFIGLPVPAHALFWASLIPVWTPSAADTLWNGLLNLPATACLIHLPAVYILAVTALLALGSSWLLVSEIPMFSLKMNATGRSGNGIRCGLILAAAAFVAAIGVAGIPLTIVLYVLLAIFNRQE
jgi:CDP-diacylglycerol--serine O-phosphatidyltransferase